MDERIGTYRLERRLGQGGMGEVFLAWDDRLERRVAINELANAVERAVVLGDGELIRPEDLPESVLEAPAAGRAPVTRYHDTLNETKKRLIVDAVQQAGGNITRAAELLGLQGNYLHRLISNLDLRDRIKG